MQMPFGKLLFLTLLICGVVIPVTDSMALHAEGKPHGEDSDYIGSEECGKCHLKEYKSWDETNLSKALLVLGPRKKMKLKKELGLDPYMDYTKEPKCLRCHTTGFRMKDNGSYTFSEYGIGCEVCHGAGGKYSKIMRSRGRDYDRQELVDAGLDIELREVCLKCHNTESPVIGKDYKFSHKERYKRVHAPATLKYHQKIERVTDEEEKK